MCILLMDAAAPLIGFALFLLGTARPILAGLAILSLGLGLGIADRVKRAVLDEPVVFADRAELLDVVRHPRFYLAFVGMWQMVVGGLACVAVISGLVWAEPPLWRESLPVALTAALLAAALGRACFVLPTWAPLLRGSSGWYARLAPSRDPAVDAARFGLMASCIVQATLARAERPDRQARARAIALPQCPAGAGPIILVQGESFVDAGRLHPALADQLPHFARLTREAALAGRLEVPCWGANTIRTELEAVSGIDASILGLDRFNPYEAFARVALPSLARQARAAGYRTVCVHPYSRTFYGRDVVMPLLGFDRFVGIEAFADAPRDGGYVTDVALAGFVADLVRAEGPDIFVFVITMENHGPWDGAHDPLPPAALPEDWQGLADAGQIGRWLRHLAASDAMIPILRACIEEAGRGCLGFYGDHQPSLAGPFHARGGPDRRTDYALWSATRLAGPRIDLAASDIAARMLGLLDGDQSASMRSTISG